MTDMNDLIRARRARTTVETDSGVDPAYAAAAWRAHLDDRMHPNGPTFGQRAPVISQRPATTNERLRSMFDNRPRARGSYRVGAAQ